MAIRIGIQDMTRDDITELDDNDLIELDVPEDAENAERAMEVLRAFIADGQLFVSLDSEAFEDRDAEWGRLLGHIAHHIARAAHLQGFSHESEALGAIRDAFNATIPLNQPTMSGSVKGRATH